MRKKIVLIFYLFRNSGVIKQYRGRLKKEGKGYRFVSDPFKMGPLRGQVTFTVSPLQKNKYIERFYFNVLLPGSNKVVKRKMMANLIFTKDQKWWKKSGKADKAKLDQSQHKHSIEKKTLKPPARNGRALGRDNKVK